MHARSLVAAAAILAMTSGSVAARDLSVVALPSLEQAIQEVFARPEAEAPRESGYVALMEACLVVLRSRAGQPEPDELSIYRPPLPNLWRVPDALARCALRVSFGWNSTGADVDAALAAIARLVARREAA